MRGVLIFLLAFGLFFLSTTAEGADWELVVMGKDSSVSWFVDKESIRHVSKTVVRAWVKVVTQKPEPYKSKLFKEALIYEEHYCNEGKYIDLQRIYYYVDGTSFSISNPRPEDPREWKFVVPDSIASFIHKYLCKKLQQAPLTESLIPDTETAPTLYTKSSDYRVQENDWVKIIDQFVEKKTADEFYKGLDMAVPEFERGKLFKTLYVKIKFLKPCTATTKFDEWFKKQNNVDEMIPLDELDKEGQLILNLALLIKAYEKGDEREQQEIKKLIKEQFPDTDPDISLLEYTTQAFRCSYKNKIFFTFFSLKGEELSTYSHFPMATKKTDMLSGDTLLTSCSIPDDATSWHVWVPK